MRKLILIAALMLASASAFAGETRSLTLASNDVLAAPSQPTVDRASVSKIAVRLAQAAAPMTTQSDAAPTLPQTTTTTTQTEAPAAVQTADSGDHDSASDDHHDDHDRRHQAGDPKTATKPARQRIRRAKGSPHRRQVWRALVRSVALSKAL